MRGTSLMAGCLLAGLLASGPALATELQFNYGGQSIDDTTYSFLSPSSMLSTTGVRFSIPLELRPRLSLFGGYQYGSVSSTNATYAYDDYAESDSNSFYPEDVWADADFRFHGLEAGVRLSFPLRRWLTPYATVSARGYLGSLELTDALTGWAHEDPDDPTGETMEYELEPTRGLGFGGGIEASIGLALTFRKPASRPVAVAMLTRQEIIDARQSVDESLGSTTAPASDEGADSSTDPASEGSPSSMPEVTSEGEPPEDGAQAPTQVQEGDVSSTERGTTLGPDDVAPDIALRSREGRWYWGVNVEAGYGLLSNLYFREMGSLDLGATRIQLGAFINF